MIIAANLKTNLTRSETANYLETLENILGTKDTENRVFVFPATSSLQKHEGSVVIGAQNAYPTQNGAFTGEIGNTHLEEFEIQTILIGHSERRHILGESQEEIVDKFNYYKSLAYTIVYCIGEPLEIREAGEAVMLEYLQKQYEGIDTSYENLVIAYEPVWAIGTGKVPTYEEIESLHTQLKSKSSAPLLYGGSVKVANAQEIVNLKNVDGVLVGSAALDPQDFAQMCIAK